MFKIFKRLFFVPSINIFLISFVSFYIAFAILTLNNIYKKSLDNSLASKQPHIEMRYKSIEKVLSLQEISQITNKIKKSKNIESCNAFTDGKMILKLFSYRNLSTTSALGNIRVIGLYPSIPFSYSLEEAKLYSMDFEDTEPTYKEFLYKFLQNKNLALINQTLFNMLSNPINSTTNFDITSFLNNKKVTTIKTNVVGTFIDFSEKPTIILYYIQANKLLNFPELRVSGFMIKVKNLDKLNSSVKFLKKEFPNLKITTWLDKNKKQNNIYSIFSVISMMVGFIILTLSILISLLILYRTFIKKLNQIIILQKIGYDLRNKIIIYLSIINTLSFILSVVFLNISIKYIANYFNISLQETSNLYLIYVYFIYILLFLFLAKKIMSQKVKI
jgi:ABC-type lipoprotein release transport system permease subunit